MYNLKIALSSVFYSLCLFIALSGSLLSLPDGFLVINSDLNHITIEYCPQFNNFQEIKYEDGSISWYPLISGTSLSNHNNGEPSHLVIIKSLTVPGPNLFSIENIETSDIKYFNKLITPNNIYDKIDKQMYQSYKLPPWATLEYAGIARNRYIAHLKITATRYNPLTGNIEIPSKVKVKIKFNSLLSGNDNYKMIDDYDNSASINHNISRKWIIPSTTKNSKLDIVKSTVSDKILNVNNQTWLKIKIEEEGVYKIDATQLAKFGFNIASDDPATIQIFGNDGKELSENVYDALNNKMNEQEIIIKTKQGNELDYILFYAKPAYGFEYKSGKFKHYINLFSKYNYYLLTWGGSSGKRANVIEPPNGTPALEPMTYTEMLFHEEELYNAFEYPGSGREWFGRYIMSNSQSNEYTNVLYNLEPDSKISYNFSFAHRSNSTGTFSVKESNKKILSIDVPPRSGYVSSVRRRVSSETSSNDISNNKIVLDFDYNSSSGIASAYLDWFEIYYTRKFIPVDNQISFFTDPKHQGIIQYSINGFQGEEIFGFDITNPANPKLLKNLSQTGGMFIFKTTVEQNNPGRFYITSKIKNANLEKTNFGNLRTNFANTDIIIITHNQLLESAILFKEYRTAFSNLTATIILTEHIFNEFSSGIADPTAIRDYLAFAYTYWSNKPKYVVLWGDGHYDYKNIEYNSINYIPPYESFENLDSFDGVQSFTSDDFFARIVGDDPIIDIAIGRIPVDSPETGLWMVEKIKLYENSSSIDNWKTIITLVADDSWSPQSSSPETFHTSQSESLSTKIPDEIQLRKIYLSEYPKENIPNGKRKPLVPEDILSDINTTGTFMINWIGHGNPRVWANEEALDRDTHIPQMQNIERLFFMTAATCDYGRFDMPDRSKRSGTEEMLLSKYGGSIGGFAATRLVYAIDNAAINEKFYSELFSKNEQSGQYTRLGDALYRVKQVKFNSNDVKYNLLGDPTLKLLIPEYIVKIDSINGEFLDNKTEPVSLKALSPVRISGSVLKLSSDEIDDTFNGIAVLTMLDGDENILVEDTGWKGAFLDILKHGGALNRSSYKVKNGKFIAEFIIPKDISYSNGNGRLYVYAYTPDKKYAKGGTRKYKIDGIISGDFTDKNGPQINIYLDSRYFKPFDIVRQTPLLIVDLSDESGINTTGKGIGRKIEAWIDDNPASIDLTNYFKTSLENTDYNGTVEKILFRLEPGLHKIAVRAWDVYNNHTIEETYFRIQPDNQSVIYNLYNYPNPLREGTTFKFSYNMNPPLQVNLNIYNSLGEKIYSYYGSTMNLQTSEIIWDGKRDNGQLPAVGVYYYRLELSDKYGATAYSSGSLSLIR